MLWWWHYYIKSFKVQLQGGYWNMVSAIFINHISSFRAHHPDQTRYHQKPVSVPDIQVMQPLPIQYPRLGIAYNWKITEHTPNSYGIIHWNRLMKFHLLISFSLKFHFLYTNRPGVKCVNYSISSGVVLVNYSFSLNSCPTWHIHTWQMGNAMHLSTSLIDLIIWVSDRE